MGIRKRASTLTTVEKQRYVSVMTQLIDAPGDPNPYGRQDGFHAEDHMMHPFMGPLGVQRFLPWHRVYLLRLEEMGRAIDAQFSIPYWDWTSEKKVPPFLKSFKPTVKALGPDIHVTRSPHKPPTLPSASSINSLMTLPNHTDFSTSIDSPHGAVHLWCHGTMSNIPTAPADPVFWLHHAMIDKIWADWQVSHPGAKPSLTGSDRVMDPWGETADGVISIAALGYSYAA